MPIRVYISNYLKIENKGPHRKNNCNNLINQKPIQYKKLVSKNSLKGSIAISTWLSSFKKLESSLQLSCQHNKYNCLNLGKTKVLVSGAEGEKSVSKIDPYGICGKRVMANSVLCVKYGKWIDGTVDV